MAELYNAEKLKEYCNWFYRRNSSVLMLMNTGEADIGDNEMSLKQ